MDDLAAAREARRLEQHLVELERERTALVAALLANTEHREWAEEKLERLNRG